MSKMLACLMVFLAVCGSVRAATPTLADKCSSQFQKVAMCLSYATGKADKPTKECCESVKGIRESTPECLCYVIQQANSGSDEIKKMGLQIGKLIQLPTACDLKNATASNCPKLLGIPAGSPEAAIFTSNATTSSTPTSSSTPAGQTPPISAKDSSGITRLAPQSAALMAISVAIFFFFFAFPAVGSINL